MKTIIHNILILTSLVIATFSQAESLVTKDPIPFIASKGSRFDICKEVATYINKHRDFYDSDPRELFTIKEGGFSKPMGKPATLERYIQIELQSIASHPIRLTGYPSGWKSRIKTIEQTMEEDLVVTEIIVDINNDGITERVLNYSYYNSKYKFWGHVNTVLDDKGNINLAFGKGRVTTGEQFYYGGRTFAYRRNGQSNRVYENFPLYKDMNKMSSNPNNMIGLLDKPAICEITQKH